MREQGDHGCVASLAVLLKQDLGLVGVVVGQHYKEVLGQLSDSMVQSNRRNIPINGGGNGVAWRLNGRRLTGRLTELPTAGLLGDGGRGSWGDFPSRMRSE